MNRRCKGTPCEPAWGLGADRRATPLISRNAEGSSTGAYSKLRAMIAALRVDSRLQQQFKSSATPQAAVRSMYCLMRRMTRYARSRGLSIRLVPLAIFHMSSHVCQTLAKSVKRHRPPGAPSRSSSGGKNIQLPDQIRQTAFSPEASVDAGK